MMSALPPKGAMYVSGRYWCDLKGHPWYSNSEFDFRRVENPRENTDAIRAVRAFYIDWIMRRAAERIREGADVDETTRAAGREVTQYVFGYLARYQIRQAAAKAA